MRLVSRGHLSGRLAATLNKGAKGRGRTTATRLLGLSQAGVFCWSKGASMPASRYRNRNPPGPRRNTGVREFARPPRRCSYAGLCYESSAQAGEALQDEEPVLPVFAFLQSDGRDVRGAHGRPRRRRGRARDRDRHGGRDGLPTIGQLKAGDPSSPQKRCSARCRYVIEDFCALRHLRRCRRTDLSQWKNAVRPNTKTFFLEARPNRRWKSSTSPRSQRSRMRPARR